MCVGKGLELVGSVVGEQTVGRNGLIVNLRHMYIIINFLKVLVSF